MKKNLLSIGIFFQPSFSSFSIWKHKAATAKILFSLFFFLFYNSLMAQPPHNLTADASIVVPAGITSMGVQAWGGGGAGGGASGAPLLSGRSGSGGGGGAFASATITVVPGNTLAVKVAAAVNGTAGANGAAGGHSTITGFESVIYAAGGAGGIANTAGTAPVGGSGGTVASSAGTTRTPGGNGTAGNAALLSLGLSTGAGGAGAGTGGGAGGASFTSVLLGNGPGNNGSPLGGGGGGAMNSALGAAQAGGRGEHGQVIVTYTCPTYSFTGISAVPVCTSVGNTSVVTLTGVGLPAGVYTVTYSRSAPLQNGLTAAMTVTTAGTGTFTAVGLTAPGISRITVTQLQSGVCISPISTANFIDVNVYAPSVGGTTSGGSTICSGANSGGIIVSGYTGTVEKWQLAVSPFTTWFDIANSNGPGFVFGPLTQTTRFRAVVVNGTCSAATSSEVQVTVNPLPSLTVSSVTPVCFNSLPQTTALNYTNALQSPTTYSITWSASPTNNFLAVTDAALPANSISITVPAGTAPGTYTGSLTVKNSNCTSAAIPFSVVVNPLPTITTTGTVTAVCSSTGIQTTTLPYTATTNTPTRYAIDWATLTDQGSTPITFSAGAGTITGISVPANTPAGSYPGTLTIFNANNCSVNQAITLVVNPLPTITTTGTVTPVCSSTGIQSTTLPYTATTNTPTSYAIDWATLTDQGSTPITFSAGAGTITGISVPANTPAGNYTGTLTIFNANSCSVNQAITLVVNPLPTITTTGTVAPVCSSTGIQTTTLPYTATTNTPTSYAIDWAVLTDQGSTPITFSAGAGTITGISVPANTPAGNYTGTLTIFNANNCSVNQAITLVVNPLPTITTTGTVAPVCSSTGIQTTTLPYTATTNTPTRYAIDWATLTDQGSTPITFSAGAGTITGISVPANTPAGNYTGTLTIFNANNCSVNQAIILVVNPLPTIATTGTVAPVCSSTGIQTTTLPYTATTNTPTSYAIDWATLTDQGSTPITFSAGAGTITGISVPANTPAGNYTGTLTIFNANNCSVNQAITLVVNPLPTITTTGTVTPVCSSAGIQTTTLPYTATTNTPTSYAIDWATLSDQGSTPITFSAGAGTITGISVPANTPAGNYTGTLTIFNANNCSVNQAITLVVNPLPNITTTGTVAPVCSSAGIQTTTLPYTATTNTPTSYAIDWATLTDQGLTPITFSAGAGTITGISVPANTPAGSYTGTLTIFNGNNCSVNQAITLVVNALPSQPVATVTKLPNCSDSTGTITVTSPASGTGYTYSIDGVNYSNTSGIFTGLSAGTYSITVRSSASCTSPILSLIVDPATVKEWNGSVNANWNNAANWTPSGVPVSTDCVEIPLVGNAPIVSGTNATFAMHTLTVEDNGLMIVNPTNTITVTNAVTVSNSGSLIFEDRSSLVQLSNAVNSGNITYRRKTTPVRRYDFTYWSSPVTRTPGFTLKNLSPGTLGDKYYKYNPLSGWSISYNGAEVMGKGAGYSVRAPQSFSLSVPAVYDAEFVGVPNNGPVNISLGGADTWSLIGNPYPSAVYADQFIADNQANLYGTLYFWTHNSLPSSSVPGDAQNNYTESDYAIYNLSGSTVPGNMEGNGATTPGNQSQPLGYIAAGQSFFVQSKTAGTAVFTNSMRVTANNSQFYKTTAVIERHRVWLNLSNTQGAFKQLLIGYVQGATNFWDNNYDAITMDANKYLDFYSINEDKKLVIQGRALPFNDTDVLPLGYRSAIVSEFSIEIDHADGLLNTTPVYLEDKKMGVVHNLQKSSYKFKTEIGTFDDRFLIRFGSGTLGQDEFEKTANDVYVSVKDNTIKVSSETLQENLADIFVYDISGKLLFTKKAIGDTQFSIENFQVANQVLVLKIVLENGTVKTTKVIF
ncbi:T9SS sorting signal type C domain-containing protein [Flavobacterium hungaricum]|uniref:Glycine-rich domain-containing protein n=1 Tax=Flavobacterium hungaricum TaxID=2082725 RepID=A0ABR9TPX9_9FLAO|nr:T9SS sorting signal type C domain-containing protein [Flavobacterium hungaricum]MBE8727440.1 hypothetical protein [Flavobacterium hungaricum]